MGWPGWAEFPRLMMIAHLERPAMKTESDMYSRILLMWF